MLRKVLKHDLRAVYKIWLILSATAIALAIIIGMSFRIIVLGQARPLVAAFSVMGAILSIFGLVAYAVSISIIVMVRYYTSFFTDEGYLTFTLPVKRATLFNSKILNAFIWDILTGAVLMASIAIIFALIPASAENNMSLLSMFLKTIPDVLLIFGIVLENVWGWAVAFTVVTVLLAFALYVLKTLAVYCCITIGCIVAKRFKLLVAIFFLYLGSTVLNVVSYTATSVIGFAIDAISASGAVYTDNQTALMILLVLTVAIAFTAMLCALIYKFTVARIRGNLNLA